MHRLGGVCALIVVGACSQHSATGTVAMFAATTKGDDYYALPYPNDLHRAADGTLDLSDFPTNGPIVDSYRVAAQTLDGFALNAAMFVRFSDAIDPMTLPDPAGSEQPGASVFLVNIDPMSRHYDQRTPVIAHFRPDKTVTIGPNRLAVRPYPGFGLDDGTTYALVITSGVHAMSGEPVFADVDFAELMGTGGDATVRMTYQPLLSWIDSKAEVTRKDVVDAAVFTTQHATQIGPALRQGVFGTAAPVGAAVTLASATASYQLWTGTYVAPNFQSGTVPYSTSGGEISIGPDGAAIVQRMEPMRFALTVPLGPTPATGWPICIYAHGTGGDYESFVDDGTGASLAGVGIATISTDQVLHGPRNPGGDPDTDFFNFVNPYAGRDNALQGAADAWSQMRLALGLSIADTTGSRTLTFDEKRVMFFGHSQGGLTGPPFIAFEPLMTGAVLSGTGGLLYLSMLYKTQPIDFPTLLGPIVRDDPIDEDNPSIALAQLWIERADGANYARYMVRDLQKAPDGTTLAPRNIFQTEGFVDTYAPDIVIEAFATAVGGDEVVTAAEKDVDGLTLRGRSKMAPPFSANINGVTAVLAQYDAAPNDDGHFVVFDVPNAREQSTDFLGTLASTGTATVIAP